jgi:peptide-N4-(N-acetyl-beta-glucosaminyl)asparagine amidase
VLVYILDEIRALRRQNMSKQDKFRLQGEDMAEARELQGYMIASIAQSLMNVTMDAILNGRSPQQARADADGEKAREGRTEWMRAGGVGSRSASDQQNHQQNPQDAPR